MKYYAVYKGVQPGIYTSWDECKLQIHKFQGAIYKSFKTIGEAKYFFKNGNMDKEEPEIVDGLRVYTDGSCYGNGKDNSFGGYGVYFGPNDKRNISISINGRCTNNIAELSAIIHAIKILKSDLELNKSILIVTDSEYSIRCFTTYGEKFYKC